MKKQIFSLTFAVSTILLTAFPGLTNTENKVALRKIDSVRYQAVKLDNSIDAMLNPEQGGVRPMPPPPPWIPPVEEGMMNNKPQNSNIKPGSRHYTPIHHLPRSAPWNTPKRENNGQSIKKPTFPIR